MISEIDINSKDFVRLNILGEVLSRDITLSFKTDDELPEDYRDHIHSDGCRVKVYGRFNISEDQVNNFLTLRPVAVGEHLKISVSMDESISEKEILIMRSGTKETEKAFPITNALTALEFVPQGQQKYVLKVHYDDVLGFEELHTPDALQEELEELKSRMEADAAVIEYYQEQNLAEVEALLQEARLKLESAEEQIKRFIQEKQRKTMEIESEVKANK